MLSGSLAEERLPGGGTQRGYRPHSTSLHGAAGMAAWRHVALHSITTER